MSTDRGTSVASSAGRPLSLAASLGSLVKKGCIYDTFNVGSLTLTNLRWPPVPFRSQRHSLATTQWTHACRMEPSAPSKQIFGRFAQQHARKFLCAHRHILQSIIRVLNAYRLLLCAPSSGARVYLGRCASDLPEVSSIFLPCLLLRSFPSCTDRECQPSQLYQAHVFPACSQKRQSMARASSGSCKRCLVTYGLPCSA